MGITLSSKNYEVPQAAPALTAEHKIKCVLPSWSYRGWSATTRAGIGSKELQPVPQFLENCDKTGCSPLSKAQAMVVISFSAALPKCQNRAVDHSKLQRETVSS